MSPSDPPAQPPADNNLPGGDAALCAEYALGLLSPDEQRAFEQRLGSEPDLQAEVAYWCENLSDLTVDLPQVAPAPAVLRRIEIAAFGPAGPPLWRQILPYILGAVAAGVLAWAAMISGLLAPAQSTQMLQADLTPPQTAPEQGQAVRATARFDPADGTLILTDLSAPPPPGQVFQLWLILPGADAMSLGVVAAGGRGVELPAAMGAQMPGAVLALSVEPLGGSPTDAPTGPVVLSGPLTPL